ncbi:MAG: hypothetical protein LDL53_03550 [Candidatus Hydrogenedens sp.]|nr:hypothetical protein [Candidatus Hydrogenedens sp.]
MTNKWYRLCGNWELKSWGQSRYLKFTLAFIVAICLGLLESAWTTPQAPGAVKAGLGNVAIGIILIIVCLPWIWWVPGLSMLEEFIQVWIGNEGRWSPNWDWVFHHWSAGYFGINLYPVLSFPIITILCEIVYLYLLFREKGSDT